MMNSFSEEKLPYEVGEWLQLGDEESYKVVRDDGYTDYVDQGKWKNEKRHKHLNVFYEKSFMPLHTDQQDDSNVHYICQTYPNIDRTLEDGSVLRYWIDKERFDLVTNYNTVVIFDIRKGAGAIPHLVTRNNVDKVRYSSYEVWRD